MSKASSKASSRKAKGELKPQGPRGVAFDKPTKIAARHAKRFLWGDDQAGWVSDWIYGSSPKIHMMSFAMNVGARFGNSPDFKTYYNCAETYYCLKGEFTFQCPETGEVHVLRKGDMLYFPPNTWHWGYNFGTEECRILESLTPRRRRRSRPMRSSSRWLKEIAGHRAQPDRQVRARQLQEQGARHPDPPRRLRLRDRSATSSRCGSASACSTELLTTCIVDLYPGQKGEPVSHPGDKVLYVLEGQLNIHIPGGEGEWWELTEGDTAYIPGGCLHTFFNTSDARCEVSVQRGAGLSLNSIQGEGDNPPRFKRQEEKHA